MSLKEELKLKKDFATLEHEALLNIYYTASMLKKRAAEFFDQHQTTDVQFNLMLLIHHNSEPGCGLSQVRLSEMMLVNRANITSLVDRMEDAGLVERKADPDDRRTNLVCLTARAKRILESVDADYIAEVKKIMSVLTKTQMKDMVQSLEKLRTAIE